MFPWLRIIDHCNAPTKTTIPPNVLSSLMSSGVVSDSVVQPVDCFPSEAQPASRYGSDRHYNLVTTLRADISWECASLQGDGGA
jgi:hypothetical protein